MKVKVWGKQHPANLLGDLDTMGIKYEYIPYPTEKQLRMLVTKIRSFRDIITINPRYIDNKTYKNRWRYDELIKPPILEIEDDLTYPAWYIKNMSEIEYSTFIHAIKEKQEIEIENKPKLKIKRITKSHKQPDTIQLSQESIARINVTILRLINGVNTYEVMEEWSEKERAAAMILWRLAQHNKGNDMRLMAEMLTTKAQIADPYARKDDNRQID